MVMVLLWACASGREVNDKSQQSLSLNLQSSKLILSLIICVLIASTGGVYYSFFACCLLLTVGLIRACGLRHIRHFFLPGILISTIATAAIANLSPSILYQIKHGPTSTAQRFPSEAELYGLKIAQLLLPITDHRLALWSHLKAKYNANPLINENDGSSLGLIGSVGFLTLGIHLKRDSRSSIAYSEELISSTISATLQSTDRHHGIVGQKCCHFQRDS